MSSTTSACSTTVYHGNTSCAFSTQHSTAQHETRSGGQIRGTGTAVAALLANIVTLEERRKQVHGHDIKETIGILIGHMSQSHNTSAWAMLVRCCLLARAKQRDCLHRFNFYMESGGQANELDEHVARLHESCTLHNGGGLV